MLYLTIPDIDAYITTVRKHVPMTHFDVMDCSRPGMYVYFLVATQPLSGVAREADALAVWSDLLLQEESPGTPENADERTTLAAFHQDLQARIKARYDEVASLLTTGGLKLRSGIYSVEAPPVFRLRT